MRAPSFLVFFTCCLAACTAEAATATTLGSEQFDIQWGEDGALQSWSVSYGGVDASLVTSDDVGSTRITDHLQVYPATGTSPVSWTQVGSADGGTEWRSTATVDGLSITRRMHPTQDPYWFRYQLAFDNEGQVPTAAGARFDVLLGPGLGITDSGATGLADSLYLFVEPIINVDDDVMPIDLEAQGGEMELESGIAKWAGLHSRYYALVAVPANGESLEEVTASRPSGNSNGVSASYLPRVSISLTLPAIEPNNREVRELLIFAGPKVSSLLHTERANIGGIVFPGLWEWMRWLCFGLLAVLGWIHTVIADWGLSIIVLAILVRLALYPVARRALSSQQAFNEVQQEIQPQIARIKRDFKGEEQSERILALYEHFGVSPLAGLKPLMIVLIQIPVFVALFHVLGQALALRDASFLWIDSLAEPDRLFSLGVELPYIGSDFNLMPVLLAITTLATIRLAPAPAADDRSRLTQNLFLIAMALVFLVLFYPFPSGMVMYWTAANLLHVAQHLVIVRQHAPTPQS